MDVYSHLLTERIVYLGTGDRLRRRQCPHRSDVCSWRRTTRSRRSSSTSTPRAATRRRCSRSTTPCVSSSAPVTTTCIGQAVAGRRGTTRRRRARAGGRCCRMHECVLASARGSGPWHHSRSHPAGRRGRPRPQPVGAAILSRHTGPDVDDVARTTPTATGCSDAEGAVAYGLADQLLDQRGVRPPAAIGSADRRVDARGRHDGRRMDAAEQIGPIRCRVHRTPRRSSPLEGSLRPRSISERYCGEMQARSATSTSRLPWPSRTGAQPAAEQRLATAGPGSRRSGWMRMISPMATSSSGRAREGRVFAASAGLATARARAGARTPS